MTWDEFKREVDKQLKIKGISPDKEIFYIYTHCPGPSIEVRVNDGEIIISRQQ